MKKIFLALIFAFASLAAIGQADCSFCFGASTDITVNEGTSWVWSTGATTQTISGVGAGTYCVTVTDDNGCTGEGCYTVEECPELVLVCSGTDNTDCSVPNGEVTVTATGGCSGEYTYTWTESSAPVGGGQTQSGLDAGTYAVLVVDAFGCSATCEVTIIDDPQISPVTFDCDPNF